MGKYNDSEEFTDDNIVELNLLVINYGVKEHVLNHFLNHLNDLRRIKENAKDRSSVYVREYSVQINVLDGLHKINFVLVFLHFI